MLKDMGPTAGNVEQAVQNYNQINVTTHSEKSDEKLRKILFTFTQM